MTPKVKPARPHLLFLDQFDRAGGAQIFLVDLLAKLAKLGWVISVTSPHDQKIASSLQAIRSLNLLPEAPCLHRGRGVSSFLSNLVSIMRLRSRRAQNQLCIANSIPGALAARLIEPKRSQRLMIAHRVDLGYLQRFLLWLSQPALVYTVSRFAVRYYAQLGWESREVRNGFQSELFPFRTRPLGEVLQIGILGRIEAEKGMDDFVRLVQSFDQGESLCFHVFGESNDSKYEAEVKQRLASSMHTATVEFHGFTSQVYQAFAKLDLLLNLSIVRESFGRTIVEAALCGVPALSYRKGGPEELIQHGKSGVLCEDLKDVETAIRDLLKDPSQLASWGKLAHEKAMCFDIKKTVLQFSESLETYTEATFD
jgi:glycosyltransferase involved in cell wall biosynthesis